jgi:hypothetical protein
MYLTTEIITPTGRRVKPEVGIYKGVYNLYVDNTRVGRIKISIEKDHVYIGKMNNLTDDLPFSKRYSNVGRALHEIAFRESIRYGFGGKIEFIAETRTYLFHMSCGFVPSILGKVDVIRKSEIESAVSTATQAKLKGLSAPFYKVPLGSGPMFLLPNGIAKLKALYFPPHKNQSTPPEKTKAHPVLSNLISDPIYQKVEQLVSLGKLSNRDAKELKTKLLHPSHSGDKDTWRQVLSSPCLEAFDKGHFNGWVVGVYFSQTQSPKLKYMLSPWGHYAFSRFLIGWQDCEASYAETLQFVLSDYGLKALEEGLIKPTHFRGQLPTQDEFSKKLYKQLKVRGIEPEKLFSLYPIAKPQNAVRIGIV